MGGARARGQGGDEASSATSSTTGRGATSIDGVAWEAFGSVTGVGVGGVFSDIAYGRCRYVAARQRVKDGVRQPLLAITDTPN